MHKKYIFSYECMFPSGWPLCQVMESPCVHFFPTLKLWTKVFTLISSNQLLIHDIKFCFKYQWAENRFSNELQFTPRWRGSVLMWLLFIWALVNSNKLYSHVHRDICIILIWWPRLTSSHLEVTPAIFLTLNQFSEKIISKVFSFLSFFHPIHSKPAYN